MSRLYAALKRQTRRLQFYEIFSAFCLLSIFAAIGFSFASVVALIAHSLKFFSEYSEFVFLVTLAAASIAGIFYIYPRILKAVRLNAKDAASEIEKQSAFFKYNPDWKSELVSAAAFQIKNPISEFEDAHIKRVNAEIQAMTVEVLPHRYLAFQLLTAVVAFALASQLPSHQSLPLPNKVAAWAPTNFEILLPYPGATWMNQSGALSGVVGSHVRFETPKSDFTQTYIFLQKVNGQWLAIRCGDYCELKLKEPGQYAVGSLYARSSFFPLQVLVDELPKSALFAEVQGELVPALSLEVVNQKTLNLEITASDDLRLAKVQVLHRFQETESILETFETTSKFLKKPFVLSFEGWKGGEHEILLRPFDDFNSSDSSPLKILFNDENSLREKRIQDLNALVNDWTHVLADLLETKLDRKLSENLPKRLREIQYPTAEDQTLLAGYINELQRLSKRIETWAEQGGALNRVDDLVSRTERQLLYGLSLIFQEKAGDIESASNDLSQTQNDLAKLMEKIKEGKLDLHSSVLEEAFKKLAEKLEELQKKISSLPQGPQDSMINREALEAQAAESETLQQKIDEIRKQAASGDEKGAMKELDSLLNQLSILSKEMERGLDQWKKNLDEGSLQKAEAFTKKLEELRKQEQELNANTEVLKEKMDQFEKQSPGIFTPKDAKELKELQEESQSLEKEQKGLTERLEEARKDFDTAMEGSEWKQLLRSQEVQQQEDEIADRMYEAENRLKEERLLDAGTQQKEAVELLTKAIEQQQQKMKQVQKMTEGQASQGKRREKVEIRGSEAKGERERRRRIMESLKHQVGDKYQNSHERYFEELLQR